jgi:hypothetical protein
LVALRGPKIGNPLFGEALNIPKAESRNSAFSLKPAAASGGRFQAAIDRRIGFFLRSALTEPAAL